MANDETIRPGEEDADFRAPETGKVVDFAAYRA